MAIYVPDEGNIVWLNFTPQSGHEQSGRRPAVVLSPKAYNIRSGLIVCVPITNQIKGYPFEVMLSGSGTTGASQDSCRLTHATNRFKFSGCTGLRIPASRSGLSVTGPAGVQLRVSPDQRAGWRSRAWR